MEVVVQMLSSSTIVELLDLPTTKHPRPCKLKWHNDIGEVKVNKKVLISFSIGRYEDEIQCYLVPMHARHLLLGQP